MLVKKMGMWIVIPIADKLEYITIPYAETDALIIADKLDYITIPYTETDTFPLIIDEEFIEKLSQFEDFNIQTVIPKPKTQKEVEDIAKQRCDPENITLSTYQTTVRNFLSNDTPYNGLLLFHGLGTGKTCTSITVAEEHRKFLKQSGLLGTKREKRIYVLGGPNIKANFKKQLFDSSQLENKQGEWVFKKSCLGNSLLREVNPANLTLEKEELIARIQDIIRRYYKFMGYIEFANMVSKLKKSEIKLEFEHSMIIVDEVQNIKENDVEGTFTASNAIDLITEKTTVKLLFLSATPMFNEPSEIVWIMNMLNQNDKRATIVENDFFKEGELFENRTEDFLHHVRGYVSFVKGENPYTFPYRVYPDKFDRRGLPPPTLDIYDQPVGSRALKTKVYPVQLSEYQAERYVAKLKLIANDVKNFTANIALLSVLNMSYPDQANDLTYMKKANGKYEYHDKREHCFDQGNIEKYSAKIHAICNHIKDSTGIVLIYSRMISEGVIPMALAIESMGYENINGNLLSRSSTSGLKYCLIIGETNPRVAAESIKLINSSENNKGDKIKVVIISEAASEGVDLSNIRQIHIMDPWWHLNRNEQTIGRGIRLCSHKRLPFDQRNAQIFLYVSFFKDEEVHEAFEYYLYRYAEEKASKIGKIARLLKENAIDCVMNHAQFVPVEKMNLVVKQTLSNNTTIDYPIGDHPYSVLCDFMECSYDCTKNQQVVYPRKLFDLDRTIEQIRTLFKHGYVYTTQDLFRELGLTVPMTYDQLYEALTQMMDLRMECKDMVGRSGYLVNYGKYYLFQPNQLPGSVPVYERRIPPNQTYHSIVVRPERPIQVINVSGLFGTMQKQYENATQPSTNKKDKDWYDMVDGIKPHMIETLTKYDEELDSNLFNQCIVDHIIEMLFYPQCLELINHLFFNTDLTPFELMAKDYFQVVNDVVCLWNKDKIVHLRKNETWEEIFVPESKRPLPKNFGAVVGGVVNNKDDERFFKSKSMIPTKGATHGQICSQAAKDLVHLRLKEVLPNDYGNMDKNQMCCELEMLLRYLQKIDYTKKIWFLSSVEVIEHSKNTQDNADFVVNLIKK